MRKTSREIARLFSDEKVTNPNAVATLKTVAVGTDKALRFHATIGIGANTYEVADNSGKIKVFPDVDSVLKYAAKAAEKGNGVYTVEVDTGALLASSVPSDLKSWGDSQIQRLGKVKTEQQGVITSIDNKLGFMVGWENGNAAQRAKKVEMQAQRACVVTDIAAIDTEVARLGTLFAAPSAP